MSKTKVLIIFPYSGYNAGSSMERLFWKMCELAREVTGDSNPLVILNRDTEEEGFAESFLNDKRARSLLIEKVWSVDTCQMWLHGWGYILDKLQEYDRIVQLPGDIAFITEEKSFFRDLKTFLASGDRYHIVIGDFVSGEKYGSKDLIDQYGTYALIANWFPKLTRSILNLPLNRPRSEFLNMNTDTLKILLKRRKFAYEQTLNLLIQCWDFEEEKWSYDVASHNLGALEDEGAFRQYLGCLDQIERTERMLKLLWRELNKPLDENRIQEFIDLYHKRDRISTSSRESAAITIKSLLGISTSDI